MTRLKLHLLGGFLIESDAGPIPPIPSAAGRSLFAYLATNRDRRHTRGLLAGMFWPEHSEPSARRRLSQTLWQIQTALHAAGADESLIQATPGDLSLRPGADCWVDVVEFEERIAQAPSPFGGDLRQVDQLEAAVRLYRGDFLSGFYDDWVDIERERLRSLYLQALHRLVTVHKGRADYEAALSFARRLALHDPLREDAHREVMRLCFLLGRSNEAIQQYERCVAVLEEELGAAPSAETTELWRQITELREKGQRPFAPTLGSPLLDKDRRVPLVGRDAERTAVLHRFEDTLRGRGGVVLIEGDPGIGKTRLLQELADDAQWRGLTPLWADCEVEALYPYETIRRAIESGLSPLRVEQLGETLDKVWLADLARIVPSARTWLPRFLEPSALRPDEERQRIHQALQRTLLAFGELTPHVVFVDDVQWIDEESMRVIGDLTRGLLHRTLLLCLSYRRDEARARPELWKQLVEIDDFIRSERVVLKPLTLDETTRLIEESLAVTSISSDMAEGLYLETGGSPLFLLETLRSLHEETHQSAIGAEDRPTSPGGAERMLPIEGGVADVIARRIAALAAPARTVLEAAAVLGPVIDPAVLTNVSNLSRLETLNATEDLIDRGIIVESHNQYRFAHYQIRRVVLNGIPTDLRKRLHHEVATTLQESRPDRLEDLAFHYAAAEITDQAFLFSQKAGRRAMSLSAYETAAAHFTIAAKFAASASIPHEQLFAVLADWEETLDVLGRRDEQYSVVERLQQSAGTDSALVAEALRRRARLLAHQGHYREALQAIDAALALADVASVPRGSILQTLGLVLSLSGRASEAVPHLEAAVAALSSDHSAEAGARCSLGDILGDMQRYDEALTQLTQARTLYVQLGDQRGIAEATGLLAIVHMERGDSDTAIDLYRNALEISRNLGYQRGEAVNLVNLANLLYFQGRLGEALTHYAQAAHAFATLGDRRGEALALANSASVRHTVLGDPTVEGDVRTARTFFSSEAHPWGEAFCLEILASIARRNGRLGEARHQLATGLALLADGGHRWLEAHLLRLMALVELDDLHLPEAQSCIDTARSICRELGLDQVIPTVESIAALVALASGKAEEALLTARAATEMLSRGAEQPHVVWYRRYLAAQATGAADEARAALAEAARVLDEILEGLDDAERKQALETVPENRAIVETCQRTWPQRTCLPLPRADAPMGRPLRHDDWTEVYWTITEPDDYTITNSGERRRHRLLRLVHEAQQQGGSPRVEDLATGVGVTEVTVRRDLMILRRRGHSMRTRGSR